MATLTIPNTFVTGNVIDANQMNANFTAVKTFAESTTTGTNIDAGAIGTAALADGSVTTIKIATGAVTTTTIAASVTLTTPNIGVATGTSLATTGTVVSHFQQNPQVASYTNFTWFNFKCIWLYSLSLFFASNKLCHIIVD